MTSASSLSSYSILSLPRVPVPIDELETETSINQAETEKDIDEILSALQSPPERLTLPSRVVVYLDSLSLQRQAHVQWLARNLFSLSANFVVLDASKPWMLYWICHSLDLLGVPLDEPTKTRGISTILHCQHPRGGFGGGPNQSPHLLPTYGSICSLAILGGGWESINRKGLYDFFMSLKCEDGGFKVCQGGEIDVRGTYCLLAVATLLDLITPELTKNTAKWLTSLQTYEGGFAPSSSSSSPLSEAHGGYTSCSTLSYHLLQPVFTTAPEYRPTPEPDFNAAAHWFTHMQANAIDGGGFKGRTNKLVDGCYGWWVGGGFTVLESFLEGRGEEDLKEFAKEDAMLYNRVALQEFILLLAQDPKGGCRDKPGKRPDLYHTSNNLSGLSLSQHKLVHSSAKKSTLRDEWKLRQNGRAEGEEALSKEVFANTLAWKEVDSLFLAVGGDRNRINTTHPGLNVLMMRAEPMMRHFYGQSLQPTPKAE